MNKTTILEARKRAYEFIELSVLTLNAEKENEYLFMSGSKLTGALRRKSMDLTRALSIMRSSQEK